MSLRPNKPTTTPISREPRLLVSASMSCQLRMFDRLKHHEVLLVGTVVNLSHGGMFVTTEDDCAPEAEIVVELSEDAGERPVILDGWVVHMTGGGMGIQFGELDQHAQMFIDRQLTPQPTP